MKMAWKFAFAMAVFGALPGFIINSFSGSALFLYGGISNIHLMLSWYLFAAIPMLGPFCFIAGFVGAYLIRLTQESPNKWLTDLSIITLPLLAGIPLAFLWNGYEVWGSSVFWAAAFFVFRKKIFGEAKDNPDPGIQKVYRWITEYK